VIARVRFSVRVSGCVQGVGFRYFTKTVAGRLGVDGWVRNESDGSVFCEVQGDLETIEEFVGELRRGPGYARVDDVVTEPINMIEEDGSGFAIC